MADLETKPSTARFNWPVAMGVLVAGAASVPLSLVLARVLLEQLVVSVAALSLITAAAGAWLVRSIRHRARL